MTDVTKLTCAQDDACSCAVVDYIREFDESLRASTDDEAEDKFLSALWK